MINSAKLTLIDGVDIIVPDSLDLITPYVLLEQQDWFEDEIKFLRLAVQSGQKVIDIGANYVVYTLSMAKRVGPTGHVWAFEPASQTAEMLAASIRENNFSQVTLVQSALSKEEGTATLSLNDNSELNALVQDTPALGKGETVKIVTLDFCMDAYGWKGIDFIKIDAEGEEFNIIRGGTRFLSTESPLIQYEIKAGNDIHLELVQAFADVGFNSYRLIPGLNVLIPFDQSEPIDDYLLNLFACKPDRAKQLTAQSFLLENRCELTETEIMSFEKTHGWRNNLAKFPYGEILARQWQSNVVAEPMHGWRAIIAKSLFGKNLTKHGHTTDATERIQEVEKALALYAISKDNVYPISKRFAALSDCFERMKKVCESSPNQLHLATLSRVARDFGARGITVHALKELCSVLFQGQEIDLGEPFLTPGERFERIDPKDAIGDWIAASALEELERNQGFSSFYTAKSSMQNLEIITRLGLGSAEMKRRQELINLAKN